MKKENLFLKKQSHPGSYLFVDVPFLILGFEKLINQKEAGWLIAGILYTLGIGVMWYEYKHPKPINIEPEILVNSIDK